MALIALKDPFTGEFPREQPQDLPPNAAQMSLDCDFTRGNLSGIRARSVVQYLPTAPAALFVYEPTGLLYAWNRDVDAVRGPVVEDQYQRFYWADGAGVYVSRGDVGGGGQEPAATNRYAVGVPKPAALTLDASSNQFQLPDITDYAFTLFCEGADGSRNNSSAVTPTSDTNDSTPVRTSRTWVFNAASPCPSNSSSTGANTGSLPPYQGEIVLSGGEVLPVYGANGTYYAHWPDWQSAPLPAQVNVASGNAALVLAVAMFSVGNGWYSNVQTVTPPNGGAAPSSTTVASAGPAVEVAMTRKDGSVLKAVLRTSESASTWPADITGFAGSISLSGSTLMLTMRSQAGLLQARAYTYTYVNTYGEEGAAADPLFIDDVDDGQAVALRYTPPPMGAYCPIGTIRFYRTATGSGGTNYLLTDEVVVNSTSPVYIDTKKTELLGESLSTVDFLPPDPLLRGLIALPNGVLAGFKDNEVHFSEPYLPYAWKRTNIKSLPNAVKGLAVVDGALFVTTTANPQLITGADPASMTPMRLASPLAGVAKGAICTVGNAVVYASPEGLALARGLDVTLDASERFFTREVWRDLCVNKLSVMRLAAHGGQVLIWFADGTAPILMRLDEDGGSLTHLSEPIYAAFRYPQQDALWVAQGAVLYEFKGGGTTKPCAWQSRDFIQPKPVNFAVLQLVGAGALNYTVYADGAATGAGAISLSLSDRNVFRLPAGFLARRWSLRFDLVAGASLSEAYLATSAAELANV